MKHAGAITLLIQHGASPGRPDADGRSFLHHLAEPLYPHPHRGIADATLKDAHLATTLAARLQNINTTNKSAILNHRDDTGATALHLAARSASDTVAALLLTRGADPDLTFSGKGIGGWEDEEPDEGKEKGKDQKDREGEEKGSREVERNERGATALHLAARRPVWLSSSFMMYDEREYGAWNRRAARLKGLLLNGGADAGARDGRGMLAVEAEDETWVEIRKVREKYLEWSAVSREQAQQ
jgi:hypothetical protein